MQLKEQGSWQRSYLILDPTLTLDPDAAGVLLDKQLLQQKE